MRSPNEFYQTEREMRQRMPHPADAQTRGLALWTFGTITARNGCQNAVIAALLPFSGRFGAVRQRLREWLRDGSDRARPLPKSDRRPRLLRSADGAGSVAVEIRRPRARHRPDDALRQAGRRGRRRRLSRMRHPGRVGRHARQQARRVDSPGGRVAGVAVSSDSLAHESNRDG